MATVIGKTSAKLDELFAKAITKIAMTNGRMMVTTLDGAVTDAGALDNMFTTAGTPPLFPGIWSVPLNHALNTEVVSVDILLVATKEPINLQWEVVDANKVRFMADYQMTAGSYRVIIRGA